jgi:hypothetical protein
MSTLVNRLLWAALCAVIALGIVFDLHRLPLGVSRVTLIPAQGLGFESVELALDKSELALYNKAEVVKRCYTVGNQSFLLIAVDGSRNRHAVHDPIYCFKGAGWQIVRSRTVSIEGGEALMMRLRKDSTRDLLYWFSDGRTRHCSVVRYWIQATIRRITMGLSGEEPVLVILQSIEGSEVDFMKVMDQIGVFFEV